MSCCVTEDNDEYVFVIIGSIGGAGAAGIGVVVANLPTTGCGAVALLLGISQPTISGPVLLGALAGGAVGGTVIGSQAGNVVNGVSNGSIWIAKKSAGNKQSAVENPSVEKTEMEWMHWEHEIWNL